MMNRFFLVGCPRSGTTLLQAILSSHSKILSFPESHFFSSLYFKGYKRKLNTIFRLTNKKRSHRRVLEFTDDCIQIIKKPLKYNPSSNSLRSHITSFIDILDEITFQNGKEAWLEKTPIHLRHIDLITKHVPSSKFIHLVRRGDDVTKSLYLASNNYSNDWSGKRSVERCMSRWKFDLLIHEKYIKHNNHHFVFYDDLISNTEEVVKQICTFLGYPFEDYMIKNYNTDYNLITTKNESWKKNVTNAIGQFDSKPEIIQALESDKLSELKLIYNSFKKSVSHNKI